MLPALKAPADPVWVMARIASLLNPYFEKDTPHEVRKMEAQDWSYAFDGLPQWAIDKAVRWWKSADNPKRRGRPVEGDIVDRVRVEMKCVRDAEAGFQLANAPDFIRRDAPKVWQPLTEAQQAEADKLVAPFVKRIKGNDWDAA